MRKMLLAVLALIVMSAPSSAQQLNVGLSQRKFNKDVVADAVIMAPEIDHIILYGQTTFKNVRPELYAAAEVPLINKRLYLGFDNGFGWTATDKKYGPGTFFTGFTSWLPIYKSYGAYGMYSYVPEQKASTLQIGLFKQVF